MIRERIEKLRKLMALNNIDAYIIPSDDFHSSEYTGIYFKEREYISGFNGSAGTVVITKDIAGLWTDGRYFLQAENQLRDTGIDLYRLGNENTPTIPAFLKENLPDNGKIGFDGRCISLSFGELLETNLSYKNVTFESSYDLVGQIWEDRPKISTEPAFLLSEELAGISRSDKLSLIREEMDKLSCSVHVLSTLDDIAWTLNIRGNDIACNPVLLAYMIIYKDKALLFANKEAVSDEIENELNKDNVELCPYNDFYMALSKLSGNILLSKERVNYLTSASLSKSAVIVNAVNPSTTLKARRNETEIKNTRAAHIDDGVAVTRFIRKFKQAISKENVTEMWVVENLEAERKKIPDYMEPSFDTIAGYASHGAIIHYEPTEETNIPVEPKGLLLLDSGGQYMRGTTDITRTIACGPLTHDEMVGYTTVLKANIAIASIHFPHGIGGMHIDALARSKFWKTNTDYKHGTGHGVGHFLNCHEGPQNLNWQTYQRKGGDIPFEDGMVISDEPGIYIEGQYGVRIENEIIVCPEETTQYGRFHSFSELTLVPIDLDPVISDMLTFEEKNYLNDYHKRVYAALSPYMDDDEKEWLKNATREI